MRTKKTFIFGVLSNLKRDGGILSFLPSCSFPLNCALFLAGKQRDVGVDLVKSLQNTKYSVDEKLEKSFISLFGKKPNTSSNAPTGPVDGQEVVNREEPLEPVEQYPSDIQDDDELDEDSDTEDEDDTESSDGERISNKQSSSKSMDDSSDEEAFNASEQHPATQSNFKEQIDFHEGRVRRKAVFGNEMDVNNLKVILLQVYTYR